MRAFVGSVKKIELKTSAYGTGIITTRKQRQICAFAD
jgi:hypothetical protein